MYSYLVGIPSSTIDCLPLEQTSTVYGTTQLGALAVMVMHRARSFIHGDQVVVPHRKPGMRNVRCDVHLGSSGCAAHIFLDAEPLFIDDLLELIQAERAELRRTARRAWSGERRRRRLGSRWSRASGATLHSSRLRAPVVRNSPSGSALRRRSERKRDTSGR